MELGLGLGLGLGEEQHLGAPRRLIALRAWHEGQARGAHDNALAHGKGEVELLHLPGGITR